MSWSGEEGIGRDREEREEELGEIFAAVVSVDQSSGTAEIPPYPLCPQPVTNSQNVYSGGVVIPCYKSAMKMATNWETVALNELPYLLQ